MSALPMDHPVPPALTSKATPSVVGNTPVSSTGAIQPSIASRDLVEIPSTPRRFSWPNKEIPPIGITPSKM